MGIQGMENYERFSVGKEAEEIERFAEVHFKLQVQINNPSREGMIEALSDAQCVAGQEIAGLEISQGETQLTPWSCIPYDYLYRKLTQYQQGLQIHAIKKNGEERFKKKVEESAKKPLRNEV